ncbi:MAG: hypothetical protein IT238_12200 [Bacteroidia bacterium]|nr:hypothetical protein [Bacteroidia bacterium]MCZ2249696.1 hypothetical protein [Bacteroidia bacterium]
MKIGKLSINIFALLLLVTSASKAQNNVGIGTNTPNASALLELQANDKGLLVPRVALTAVNSNAPIGAGIATSLLVYNTATAGTAPNDVYPGYYYWNGTRWVRWVSVIIERYTTPTFTFNAGTITNVTITGVTGCTSTSTAIVNLLGNWAVAPNLTIRHVEARTNEIRFQLENNDLFTNYGGVDFVVTIIR